MAVKADELASVSALLRRRLSSGEISVTDQEIWDWLQRVAAEFDNLRSANSKLTTRVRDLERLLDGAGGLSDDELLSELPSRMMRALQTAQEVSDEIVRRARARASQLLEQATKETEALRRKVESDARETLQRATEEAQAQMEDARERGHEMLAEARTLRARVLADLDAQRSNMERDVRRMQVTRRELLEVLASVQEALESAEMKPPAAPPAEEEPNAAPTRKAPARQPAPKPTIVDWRKKPPRRAAAPRTRTSQSGGTRRGSGTGTSDFAPAAGG